jgi:hypothetical protein
VGFLNSIFGRQKVAGPASADRLFAMSTAYIKLESELSLTTTGKAAIVFQPVGTADFDRAVTEMHELVESTGADTGTTLTSHADDFGYRWMILADPDMDDLVVGVNAVSTELQANGYGDRLLAAVFAFNGVGADAYWIYNYKRGAFYPFVPAPGDKARDSERELRLKAQVGADLPVEEELARWFPLWGIPI